MNQASSTSLYAKSGLESDDLGRPTKRIRTTSLCVMASVASLNANAIDAFQQGNYDEAEEHYTHALYRLRCASACSCHPEAVSASLRAVAKEVPSSDTMSDVVSCSSSNSSQDMTPLSKYDEGMDVYQEPESLNDVFGMPSISSRLHYNVGLCQIGRGKLDEAILSFEKSLHQVENSSEKESFFRLRVLCKVGFCYFGMGNGEEAAECFHRSLGLAVQSSSDKVVVAACLNCLAVVYFHYHPERANEAMQLLKQSLSIYRERRGDISKEVATVLNNMGRIHFLRFEYEEALSVYAEALFIRVQILGEDSIDVAATVYNSGQCYHQLGQFENAMQYYKRFIDLITKNGGPPGRDAAIVYRGIGEILQQQHDLKRAFNAFKDALQAEKQSLGKFNQQVASTLNKLGNLCYEMQDHTSALQYYQEGLEIETSILDPLHPHIVITLTNIAHIEVGRSGDCLLLNSWMSSSSLYSFSTWYPETTAQLCSSTSCLPTSL